MQAIPFQKESLIDVVRDAHIEISKMGDFNSCYQWLYESCNESLLLNIRVAKRNIDKAFNDEDAAGVRLTTSRYIDVWKRMFYLFDKHCKNISLFE